MYEFSGTPRMGVECRIDVDILTLQNGADCRFYVLFQLAVRGSLLPHRTWDHNIEDAPHARFVVSNVPQW